MRSAVVVIVALFAFTSVLAQQSVTRLRIDAVAPAVESALRVQTATCSDEACLVVFGGMRDSADAVAWPTIYWMRSIGADVDSTIRRLPDWARPTGAVAVAPAEGGYLLVWSDARDGNPAILSLSLDRSGAIVGEPWVVLEGRAGSLRLFDAAGVHLLVVVTAGEEATVLRLRGRQSVAIDTLGAGTTVWRVHGWQDHVAITTGDTTELRAIDSYDVTGRTASTRFTGTYLFESDGGLWTMIDSALEHYSRFDDEAPDSVIPTGAIATPFRGAVWIMRKSDGTIGIAYASVDAGLRVMLHRRWLDSAGVLSPPADVWIGETYVGLGEVISSDLVLSSLETDGMRVPVLRYAYTYTASHTGNTVSGTAFASIVVELDGRAVVVGGEGTWIPIDAGGDGLPIRLYRRITPDIEDVLVNVISGHRSWRLPVPRALARIETDQSLPAVVAAENGYVVAWIESSPGAPRSVKISRWNGVDDTVSVTGSRDAFRTERGQEYRQERSVGHWRYPGASIASQIETEMNHPPRPSHPAWDKASWGVYRATPDATWYARQLGDLYAPYLVRSPQPAGGSYFQTSGFDPVRDEVVILAARGSDDLALTGVGLGAERSWTRPLPVTHPTALVPVDSSDVLLVFADTLRRVGPTTITTLPTRLEKPVRYYDPLWRELDRSFIHMRIDTGDVGLDRYGFDGAPMEHASFRVSRTARWQFYAHRRRDTATAIIWSDSNLIRLSLLDRRLGVRIADSIIVRSDGEVQDAYAVFVGDDLIVAWADRGPRGSDIAILRMALDAAPASIDASTRVARREMVRVVDNVIRDGQLRLEVGDGAGPIRLELVDARGRRVLVRRIEPNRGRIDLTLENIPAGVYLVRAESAGEVVVARLVVMGR